MARKKKVKTAAKKSAGNSLTVLWLVVYWAVYLTVTMALFERTGVTPHSIPGGVFGWTVLVELPRVVLGGFISLLFFGKRSHK